MRRSLAADAVDWDDYDHCNNDTFNDERRTLHATTAFMVNSKTLILRRRQFDEFSEIHRQNQAVASTSMHCYVASWWIGLHHTCLSLYAKWAHAFTDSHSFFGFRLLFDILLIFFYFCV